MKSFVYLLLVAISTVRLVPHACLLWLSSARTAIDEDIARWQSLVLVHPVRDKYLLRVPFLALMTFYPEFRSLFYYRIGLWSLFIRFLCKPQANLYFACRRIGGGLFLEHAFSTIIAAEQIGKNCWINQQVTIGFQGAGSPTIGDNVRVCAGAKVVGRVTIGTNVTIGANAVVIRDVPDNCVVGGVPAKILKTKFRQ